MASSRATFTDRVSAEDFPSMPEEYRDLVIRLLTIQADCEIGGPHLYVDAMLPAAPSQIDQLVVARTAAEEEIAFARSLCTHPISSLIAVHRLVSDGEIRESFRRLQLREGQGHGKAFSFMEVEEDVEPDSDLRLADMSRESQHR